MRFRVSLASDQFNREDQPHPEAVWSDDDGWCMDFESLEDLMELVKRSHMRLVISRQGDHPTLMIADTWPIY